ncbi:MAG: hypothetical protein QXX77_05600 [Candidatus Methanosuratincola sp.]|jgi:hypothetical protein
MKHPLVALALLLILGCAREWKDPLTTIPAKEVDIVHLLANTINYDGAGVTVEGRVWHVEKKTAHTKEGEIPYTLFMLADRDGHGVGVYTIGHITIADGDFAEVTGLFRRSYKTETHSFNKEIEAVRVEVKQ